MNKSIFRKDKVPFSMIPNALIQDSELSAIAKSVYCYLASRPDNWMFYNVEIINNFKEGRTAVLRSIKELENIGWLSSKQLKDNGRFINKEYTLHYEKPSSVVPVTEIPSSVVPSTEMRTHNNNDYNNNDYNNNDKNKNNNNNNIYISSEKKEKENVENEMIINSYNKHFETNITDCKTTRKETNQLISSIKDYYKDISYDIIDNFFKKANESTYWMKNKAPLSYCCRYTNFLNIIQFEPKKQEKQEKQKPKRR